MNIIMRAIRGNFLSRQLEAARLGRSCLFATTSHLKRSLVCRGYLVRCERHWSKYTLLMSYPKLSDTIFLDSRHGLDTLYQFASGRWLRGEREQLAARYVKFDMQKSCRLATSSIGSKSCVRVVGMSEGQFNKVFLLTMDDGREVIAKLPNPNSG